MRDVIAVATLGLVLLAATVEVSGETFATLEVQLLGYDGNGKDSNGDRCDYGIGSGRNCDPIFTVCLGTSYSNIAPSSWKDSNAANNNCVKRSSKGPYDNRDSFSTTSNYPVWELDSTSFPNGLGPNGQGCFGIAFRLDDYDSTSSNDHMFSDGFRMCDADANGKTFKADSTWYEFNRYRSDKNNVKVKFRIRGSCVGGYGGDFCQRHCLVTGVNHRYSCSDGAHICKTGWTGQYCDQDIDACPSNSCISTATCTDLKCSTSSACSFGNNAAGRTCTCNAGYTGDGSTCTNIDACSTSPCPGDATCVDKQPPALGTPSGRTCTCKPGFVGNGELCVDANECIGSNHNCHDTTTCANVAGGFECKCKTGFIGPGSVNVVDPNVACTNICGDGVLVDGEECDDGGTSNDDGCSAACDVESGWTCLGAGPGSCTPTCGDSRLEGSETCDDGNTNAGDGCSAMCAEEAGFDCSGSGPNSCSAICGDGLAVFGEECDIGTASATNKGCTACATDDGYICVGGGENSCSTICGDGVKVSSNEQCDDGNVIAGDGCSATCATEPGWTCNGQGSNSCVENCGDSVMVGNEQCDDGNTSPGDGCSATCTVEPGYTCFGAGANQCTDVNECDTQPCHPDAICANEVGGFSCTCKDSYVGSGGTGQNLECTADCGEFQLEEAVLGGEYLTSSCSGSASTIFGGGMTCTATCRSGFEAVGDSSDFTCQESAQWTGTAPLCVDVSSAVTEGRWTQHFDAFLPLPKFGGGSGEPQVIYDNVPSGMTPTPQQGLVGRPDSTGTTIIERIIRDEAGAEVRLPPVTVTIAPAITSAGQKYQAVVNKAFTLPPRDVVGGQHPLRFSLASGALPTGVKLNNMTGFVSGSAQTVGIYSGITVAVSDANGAKLVFEPFNLIVGQPLNITWERDTLSRTIALDAPFLLEAPAHTIVNANGQVEFSVPNDLPAGLEIAPSTGTISGRPLAVGEFTFTIIASDEAADSLAVETVTLIVERLADCEVDTNGPNGRACGRGTCVDAVAFDSAFLCDCGSGPEDSNCDQLAASKSSAATTTSLAVSLPFVAMLLLAVGAMWWWRQKLFKSLAKKSAPFVFPPADDWEYDRGLLQFGGVLGQGEFGIVHAGYATDIRDLKGKSKVAIKQCKGDGVDNDEKKSFVEEAQLMKRLHHRNVVRLLGVCLQDEPLLIISELMAHGDLKSVLRSHLGLTLRQMYGFCLDVASGVEYIASQNVVHRDLAARNCLVDDTMTVKLADFGLGRDTAYKDYYRLTGQAMLPIRWMAIESLKTGAFTTHSDIWALGVVFWEIMARGEVPYAAMGNMEVFDHVQDGKRLAAPVNCPNELYAIMTKCWASGVRNRADAPWVVRELEKFIASLPEGEDEGGDTYMRPDQLLPRRSQYFKSSDVFGGQGADGLPMYQIENPLYDPTNPGGYDDDEYLTVQTTSENPENYLEAGCTIAQGGNGASGSYLQAGPSDAGDNYLQAGASDSGENYFEAGASIPSNATDNYLQTGSLEHNDEDSDASDSYLQVRTENSQPYLQTGFMHPNPSYVPGAMDDELLLESPAKEKKKKRQWLKKKGATAPAPAPAATTAMPMAPSNGIGGFGTA